MRNLGGCLKTVSSPTKIIKNAAVKRDEKHEKKTYWFEGVLPVAVEDGGHEGSIAGKP